MKRDLSAAQIFLVVIGLVIITMAVTADYLGHSSPGFGPCQILLAFMGCILLAGGVTFRVNVVRRWVRRIALSRVGLILAGLLVGSLLGELVIRATGKVGHSEYSIDRGSLLQPVPDEKLGVRLVPYCRGHDGKGFRNDVIPDRVDIVAIGDSQTWGVNALRFEAWPQTLARISGYSVYNMGLGYYGPVQYRVLVAEALELKPKVIVIGLYFGNDIYDAYAVVYSRDTYAEIRNGDVSEELQPDTIGSRSRELREELAVYRSQFRGPMHLVWGEELRRHSAGVRLLSQQGLWPDTEARYLYEATKSWAIRHPDHGAFYENGDVRTAFATAYRLLALDFDEPRIVEGLRITEDMLLHIQTITNTAGVKLLLLLIPTKEMVYANAVRESQGHLNGTYKRLVQMEGRMRAEVMSYCQKNMITYSDTLPELRGAVRRNEQIYPERGTGGHPIARGYFLIASRVHDTLSELEWLE